MLNKIQHIFFVGIGGIGMSGIAELLLNLGYRVSGSDVKSSKTTQRLQTLGARVYIGHKADNLDDVDVVVVSSAISPENPEVAAAHKRLIAVIPRAEMLAGLMRLQKYGIAVAGTHGKTTTTSLVAMVLAEGGLDPTIVVGGRLESLGSNAKLGQGDFLVAEADESDGSFLQLAPAIAIVTTIDAEHLDHYSGLEEIKDCFLEFINKVPFYGCAVLCLDEENIQSILPQIKRRYLTYGLTSQADVVGENLSFDAGKSIFSVKLQGRLMGTIELSLPGAHNVYNSLAAVAVAYDLGIPFDVVKKALEKTKAPDRRFQIKGTIGENILVVDDYAHHPVEIRAALAAAKDGWGRRTVAVFQPHRYSRLGALMADFATAFYQADYLVVTDVYAAGEVAVPGVDARCVAKLVREHGHREVHYIPALEDVVEHLRDILRPNDMVLTLGAGNVYQVADELVQKEG